MTPDKRLEIATDIAQRAGQMILEARRQGHLEERYKDGHELVTDTDVAVDTFISKQLGNAFPDDNRLSEELSPQHDSLSYSDNLWVIDPIDGTVNFAHGLRHVAVSIGWFDGTRMVIGVVHAPFLGETFTAIAGQGAWCNDQPIQVSQANDLSRSLVATGFPYQRDSRPPLMRRLQAVLAHCQDIRRNGSAALDLCDVACGRLNAYYESVSPWDFAAGLLIAREAGARTGHLYPVPDGVSPELYGENLLVTAPAIHEPLGKLLRQADADDQASR